MLMYRLIALDLDDTLLGRDGQISPADAAAVADARSAGCDVTLVTARSWRATRPFAEQLGLTAPVICMTGAVVYDVAGAVVSAAPLDLTEARHLIREADDARWCTRLYFTDGRIHQNRPADDFYPVHSSHAYPASTYVGDLSPYLEAGEAPIQVALLGNRSVEGALDQLPNLPGMVATTYDRYSGVSRTHLMHRTVSKGRALAAYCEARAIPQAAVVAMGDGEPDRSMIEWAGVGVAMGWAPSAVQAAADLVTPADDPHPVATAIHRLLQLS